MARSKFWSRLVGDYAGAADLYLAEGQLRRAANLYARGGRYEEAAQACVRAGLISEAVALFDRAGRPLRAAELLAQEGRNKEAVPFFERAGSHWAAAESALKAKQVLRAAKLFELADAHVRAAECFENVGEPDEAVRLLTAETERLADSSDKRAQRKVQIQLARMLRKAGRYPEAAGLLDTLGDPKGAAELWLKSDQTTHAIESLLAAGQVERAATLAEAVDLEPELAARVLSAGSEHQRAADAYLEVGDWRRAAEELESAGQADGAARLLEENGDLGVAAELFVREAMFEDAARCYAQDGAKRSAADALSKAGQHQLSAGLYLEIDEPVLAAREWIRAQNHTSAMLALKAVESTDDSYEDAALLLAPLLLAAGENSQALERLDALTGEASSTTRSLERSYWRARALEALGQFESARHAYSRVVARRPEHRDATRRAEALSEQLRKGGESAASREVATGKLAQGTLIANRYEIEREIGRGGMSRVYRAIDRELGERVAIKMLFPRPWDVSNAGERLLNEVQICRRIAHPNVVRVFDFGRFQGGLYITMELLEGMTLDALLKEHGRLPVLRAKGLLEEVLLGLAEAHRLRVVHRDLKPANIAVTPEHAKIMDFGIARLQDVDSKLTQTGQVIGSPMYMSPEQVQGLALDPRSDLYSVGVLAFTLLVGREPFRGRTPTAISLKHLRSPAPDLLNLCPGLHPDWGGLVARLMEKRREQRYSSAKEVLGVVQSLSA